MKFQFHPNILLIKSKINTSSSFSFTEIKTDDVDKKIRNLSSKKSGTQNDIPAKINAQVQLHQFCKNFSTKF